jgi:hypothetical protein
MPFTGGLFWTQADGTEQHEIHGLNNYVSVSLTADRLVYQADSDSGTVIGKINLKTGANYIFKDHYSQIFQAELAPDGQIMALASSEGAGKFKLNFISMDDKWLGSFIPQVGDDLGIIWSPDSTKLLLFTRSTSDLATVYFLHLDGTEIRHFNNVPQYFNSAKWTNCG